MDKIKIIRFPSVLRSPQTAARARGGRINHVTSGQINYLTLASGGKDARYHRLSAPVLTSLFGNAPTAAVYSVIDFFFLSSDLGRFPKCEILYLPNKSDFDTNKLYHTFRIIFYYETHLQTANWQLKKRRIVWVFRILDFPPSTRFL